MERFSLQCHCYGCLRFVNCHPTKLPRHHSHKKRSIIGEREREARGQGVPGKLRVKPPENTVGEKERYLPPTTDPAT